VLHLTLLSVDQAQRDKAISELCAGYGALAVAFAQAGLTGVAQRHMQRAIALAEAHPSEVNDIAYAHLLAMVYASSQCDWHVLDTSGPRAEMLYADLGDGFRRASAQVLGLVGDVQRGNYARATTTLEQMAPYVATDAPPRVVGWYYDSLLQRDIARGRVVRADVEARARTAEQVESLVDKLTSCGNTASAWLRLGETANALAAAERGLQLLGNAPVAGAGYIYGPLGVVEALLACGDRVDAAQTARACKMLETYTRRVPSTRPRGYFLLAYYEELLGSLGKAMKLWRKAAASAAKMSMPYDRAAALLALGQRLPPGNPELKEALTIFRSLDVPIPDLFQPTKPL
jgi:tetratricopeptide (TPR) repeat protein